MKIKILGTCAAEGWPAMFCDCPACRKARELGGRNIRSRCSVQFDDMLKIDVPPDTMMHAHKYNLALHKLRYILITHSHGDHLCESELEYIRDPFAVPPVAGYLKILGNSTSAEIISKSLQGIDSDNPGLLNTIKPFQELELPPYKVTTLKAEHKPDEDALNYIIEKEGKKVLYTCDTGYYQEPTWDFLKGKKVDMVICECTEGPNRADYKYHMGFPNVLEFRNKAEEIGLTGKDTPWILTHFSHGGGLMHNELEALVKPEGFDVAWDGMEIGI